MATKPTTKTSKTDNAEANRMKRLARTLKAQPNNLQVVAAMKTVRMHRKTPVAPVWSSTAKAAAKLYKTFTGYFELAIMSKDPKVSSAALQKPGKVQHIMKNMPKMPFSLKERTKDKYGNYVWT